MTNHIIVHGRLTKDVEIRQTPNGVSVANFTVAVERSFAPQGQERQTDFFDCVAWKGAGETIGKFFNKGSEIVVGGEMQQRKWQDKDGNNRYSWEILVQNFDFCGSKSDKPQTQVKNNDFELVDDLEDLPFA